MKTKIYIVFALSIILASCTSLQQASVSDDLYYSPKDEVVAKNDMNVIVSNDKTDKTRSENIFEDEISEILADESIESVDTVIYEDSLYENSYYDIVVRDRDDAHQRRIEGFMNPYYGMNYGAVYLSDAYWYASSYDPYFYNIVVMGDQVWVEPRWMTSSFGYWPRHSYHSPYYSNYYGYYDPFYSSYYSYYSPYYYHNPYHHHQYYPGSNNNYVSSSFNSYRQRSLASRWSAGSVNGRTSRELPENHTGRNVSRSSTVKSGLDRQGGRTSERVSAGTTRTTGRAVTTRTSVSRNTRDVNSANRTYTRPSSTNRSTYSTSNRPTTRYNRPTGSNVSSGRSTTTRSGTSTYSPARSNNTSRSSGSNYSTSGTSRSSGSTTRSSTTRSSGSSGTVRSSGSSSRSSGSSSGSSGSSSRSSSGSSSRGRR
ncbi:MAG: hypothetical protein JEY96_02280 [Bacteroidales bacterium]|nr:hypothetical protein [Bacteroidales bacterium]